MKTPHIHPLRTTTAAQQPLCFCFQPNAIVVKIVDTYLWKSVGFLAMLTGFIGQFGSRQSCLHGKVTQIKFEIVVNCYLLPSNTLKRLVQNKHVSKTKSQFFLLCFAFSGKKKRKLTLILYFEIKKMMCLKDKTKCNN